MDKAKKVKDIFNMAQGNSFELINMDIDNSADVNFVARTSENNGVTAKVRLFGGVEPFPAGCITVALSGSVLSSFVQTNSFYTGFHVMVLFPKKEMRLEEKLFYCHCIKMNAYRYTYGRQANRTLKDINLPLLPSWWKNFTIDYSPIATQGFRCNLPLETKIWKPFKLSALFGMERGTRLTKDNRITGKIPLATAGFANEGIAGRVANEGMKVYHDVLTIDMFCNCFYRGYKFVCDDNILVLNPLFAGANRFKMLFIATVVSADKYRYAYGRQYRQKDFREHVISLPAEKSGKPDWAFMETYIKALPYSDRI
jgi:hypothetical protein